MKHLYFMRHGESQANVDRIFAGQVDTPLTIHGKQQARDGAQKLKDIKIDHIIASPLSRALDTAMIVADVIGYPVDKIEVNSLLMERGFGSLAGLSWDADLDLDGFSDIETMDSLSERAHLAYNHILSLPYDTILVVGHGTFWQKFYMAIHPGKTVSDADEPKNAEVTQLL